MASAKDGTFEGYLYHCFTSHFVPMTPNEKCKRWKEHYMDFDRLNFLLKVAERKGRDVRQSEAPYGGINDEEGGGCLLISKKHIMQGFSRVCTFRTDVKNVRTAEAEQPFFTALDEEALRVEQFFIRQEDQLMMQLDDIQGFFESKNRAFTKSAVVDLFRSFSAVNKFALDNHDGMEQIMDRHDKAMGWKCKVQYMRAASSFGFFQSLKLVEHQLDVIQLYAAVMSGKAFESLSFAPLKADELELALKRLHNVIQLEEEPHRQLCWKRYVKDAKGRAKEAKEKKRREELELEAYFVKTHGSHEMAGCTADQIMKHVEVVREEDRRRRERRDETNLTALTPRQYKQVRWRNYLIQKERSSSSFKGRHVGSWATDLLKKIPQRPGINRLAMMDIHSLACAPAIPAELSEPVRITPWLFLGGMCDAMDLPRMKELGITHVLNCCPRVVSPNFFEAAKQLVYLRVEVEDHDDYDLAKWLARASSFVHHVRTREKAKVLVHCTWMPGHMTEPLPRKGGGSGTKPARPPHISIVKNFAFSRSSAVVMAYLVGSMKIHLARAYRMVCVLQPEAAPRESFCAQLAEWEIEQLGCTSVGGEYERRYRVDEIWDSNEVREVTSECTSTVEIDAIDEQAKPSHTSSICVTM
jgi:protein-tyrosine phosphatase